MNIDKLIEAFSNIPEPPCTGCKDFNRCRDELLACKAFRSYCGSVASARDAKDYMTPTKALYDALSKESDGPETQQQKKAREAMEKKRAEETLNRVYADPFTFNIDKNRNKYKDQIFYVKVKIKRASGRLNKLPKIIQDRGNELDKILLIDGFVGYRSKFDVYETLIREYIRVDKRLEALTVKLIELKLKDRKQTHELRRDIQES